MRPTSVMHRRNEATLEELDRHGYGIVRVEDFIDDPDGTLNPIETLRGRGYRLALAVTS